MKLNLSECLGMEPIKRVRKAKEPKTYYAFVTESGRKLYVRDSARSLRWAGWHIRTTMFWKGRDGKTVEGPGDVPDLEYEDWAAMYPAAPGYGSHFLPFEVDKEKTK